MSEHPTRAGARLNFTFARTELELIISRAVRDIESEAYKRGYDDGYSDGLDYDPDEPVIHPDEVP